MKTEWQGEWFTLPGRKTPHIVLHGDDRTACRNHARRELVPATERARPCEPCWSAAIDAERRSSYEIELAWPD